MVSIDILRSSSIRVPKSRRTFFPPRGMMQRVHLMARAFVYLFHELACEGVWKPVPSVPRASPRSVRPNSRSRHGNLLDCLRVAVPASVLERDELALCCACLSSPTEMCLVSQVNVWHFFSLKRIGTLGTTMMSIRTQW
jgi:hypothetical protein